MRNRSRLSGHTTDWFWLLAVLVCGIALRAAALAHFHADLRTDPDGYVWLAQGMAAGRGFSLPQSTTPTAFRPPLYPLLLIPISDPDQVFARGMLHLLLATATGFTLWKVGQQLQLSLAGRVIALLLYAVDPLSIRYVTLPMTETLCALLATLLLWRLTSQRDLTFGRSLLTGAIFALCVLSRPTFWLFGFFYGAYWLFQQWRKLRSEASHAPRRWQPILGCCIGVAVCVSPWAIRNAIVMGRPVVMTTHGGYTLLLGNNEAFYQEVVRQPLGTIWDGSHGPGQAVWFDHVNEQLAAEHVTGELAVDRWMSRRAQETIRRHPATFLRACLLKFLWFWSVVPHSSSGLPSAIHWFVGTFYTLFWIAGLIGLGCLAKNRARQSTERANWAAPIILMIALTSAHLVYWSDTRMRTPIMPAVSLVAAAGIECLVSRRRRSAESAGATGRPA